MAQWLGRASQELELFRHDSEVLGLNPGGVELAVGSPSVYVTLIPKYLP